ncbi:hypothetical protein [Phycicoccus sonneratiae]|uniref:Uncharacterized protein n=1 Tax=Phycicoccus sonneratiae TaxID=2807628 RepID=A0ABS2CKY0_9MICO|nr:hypothetical protein [Phycicoccus sonneraticus]MBM6400546.1 hypothetical protein [Phycicoccus sonneraticus]
MVGRHRRRTVARAWGLLACLVLASTVVTVPAHAVPAQGALDARTSVTGTLAAVTVDEPGTFRALPPTRLLDTRSGLGATRAASVPANGTITLQVAGRGGIPTTGATAATLNLTVTGATRSGHLTAYPTGTTAPTASTLNFTAGTTIANLAVTQLGTDGRISLHNGSTGTIHLVADTSGYHLSGTPTAAGAFRVLPPTRLLDTRTGLGATRAASVPANGTITLQVAGRGGIPTTGATAATLNLTVTGATRSGHLTAYPTGTTAPTASTLNFTAGTTIANLAVTQLGTDGRISLHNGSTGTIHLVADTSGHTVAGGAAPASWGEPVLVDREQGDLSDVACVSAVWCLVLDYAGNAWRYTGTSWVAAAPAPSGAVADLTCTSTTWCLAVTSDRRTMTFDGTTWSAAATLPGQGRPIQVTCPTTTFCAVSGDDGTVWRLSAGSWTADQVDSGSIRGISCPTTTFCMAAAPFGNAYVWTGGDWVQHQESRLGQEIELDCPRAGLCIAASNTDAAVYLDGTWGQEVSLPGLANGISSVSCPTTTFCRVSDNFGGHALWTGSWQPDVDDVNTASDTVCPTTTTCIGIAGDGTGAVMVRFSTTETLWTVAPPQGRPFDVSCSSRGFCGVVDERLSSVFLRDGAWQAPRPTQTDQAWLLSGIACPTDDFCAATTTGSSNDFGNILRFDGTSWSQEYDYYTAADLDCTSPTHCVAIKNGSRTVLWDGSTWSQGPGTGTWFVTSAIDCTTTTSCAAVSHYGKVSTWDGTAWTTPVQVGGTAYSDWRISCSAPGACAIAGVDGTVALLEEGAWSAPTDITTGDVGLHGISCPSEGACRASADDGRVYTLAGGTWTSELVDPRGGLRGIDCLDLDYCVVVSTAGYATVRS